MEKINFKAYFDTDLAYVEEFDTKDGRHFMGRIPVEKWTPDILELAEKLKVIK